MSATFSTSNTGRSACAIGLRHALAAASMFLTFSAQAQTPACDQLKASLTARIKPGPTGFTLETVRADDPVPPGAKAIGTCEGSVYKILLRRGVNAENAQGAASGVVAPASAAAVKAPVVVPQPALSPPTPASRSTSGPADVATKPVAAFMGPLPEPEKVVAPNDTAPAPPVQALPVDEPTPTGSRTQRAGAFVVRHWLWILPLILLPLAAWAWMWVAHRRAYDEAGLPRGPRL